jgi:hypothetical protein
MLPLLITACAVEDSSGDSSTSEQRAQQKKTEKQAAKAKAKKQADKAKARPIAGTSNPPKPKNPTPVYYENCDAVRAAGAAPIRRGDPGYASHLDRDGDGIGCED